MVGAYGLQKPVNSSQAPTDFHKQVMTHDLNLRCFFLQLAS